MFDVQGKARAFDLQAEGRAHHHHSGSRLCFSLGPHESSHARPKGCRGKEEDGKPKAWTSPHGFQSHV